MFEGVSCATCCRLRYPAGTCRLRYPAGTCRHSFAYPSRLAAHLCVGVDDWLVMPLAFFTVSEVVRVTIGGHFEAVCCALIGCVVRVRVTVFLGQFNVVLCEGVRRCNLGDLRGLNSCVG